MEFPCVLCEKYHKRKEVIEYDFNTGKLFFPVCSCLRLIVPESELNDYEKIKLARIKNELEKKNNGSGGCEFPYRYFVIRNRIYTNSSGTNLKCRISDNVDMDLLSENCPFYPEMFIFLENFKKKLIFSSKNA